jgi:hypothetical protein
LTSQQTLIKIGKRRLPAPLVADIVSKEIEKRAMDKRDEFLADQLSLNQSYIGSPRGQEAH